MPFEQAGYYLDIPEPPTRDYFDLRFNLNKRSLKYLGGDEAPTWGAFALKDQNGEHITLALICEACKTPESIEKFKETEMQRIKPFIPQEITLKTDVLWGGAQVVRKFALSETDYGSSSGIHVRWNRVKYTEESSYWGGGPWPP